MNPMISRRVFGLLALALTACAAPRKRDPGLPLLHLPPAELGRPLSLVQRLSVRRLAAIDEPPQVVDVLLEADAASLRLAGFALNQRVLTMSWDGQALTVQRHPLLPAQVEEKRILRDLCLVYWPAESLRQRLPEGWLLRADAGGRRLFDADRLALSVEFQGSEENGRVLLLNLLEGYELLIESKLQGP
ncbi:DUF3261 domain-containing protein [Roseateles oligotrophus]|uniref:DUF3261 domain-containing protein n=1 Tax=Roseateles oligotrophus TaxID=1769250 RepID=A0ABT2YDH7_9BURK|nr:DUF3261 domain-containing protein [Roseateles oligotrophus]MCV2368081.1 DUF3261 domain-containing protein [Roseateles oligotrophus]